MRLDARCTPRRAFLRAIIMWMLIVQLGLVAAAAGDPPGSDRPRAATARNDDVVPFQPGVRIDWRAPAVYVDARVVLTRGQLEFFACWPGKEHESILRIEAATEHVYAAMGLIGLTPGHPPRWNDPRGGFDDPEGDLVDIGVRWRDGDAVHEAGAYEWLLDVEYERPALPRPWVFAGSIVLADGTLAAGRSGVGVALVDFPDSLVSYSRRFPSRYGALWAWANTPAIPPVGTVVEMSLRPARMSRPSIELDARAALRVDGRYCDLPDLCDILRRVRQLDPQHVPVINVRGALHSDVRALQRALAQAGLVVRVSSPPPDADTPAPDAGGA